MAEYVCPTCAHVHALDIPPEWDLGPEEWRPIPGYIGLYEVGDHGRIRNRKGHVLRQTISDWGYCKVGLYRAGEGSKEMRVHRAVALAFIPPEIGRPFVNHIDGIKTNNLPSNLEWTSREENHQHAMDTGRNYAATNPQRGWKLSVEDVAAIRARSAAGEPCRTLAAEFGVNPTYLRKVLNGTKRLRG